MRGLLAVFLILGLLISAGLATYSNDVFSVGGSILRPIRSIANGASKVFGDFFPDFGFGDAYFLYFFDESFLNMKRNISAYAVLESSYRLNHSYEIVFSSVDDAQVLDVKLFGFDFLDSSEQLIVRMKNTISYHNSNESLDDYYPFLMFHDSNEAKYVGDLVLTYGFVPMYIDSEGFAHVHDGVGTHF